MDQQLFARLPRDLQRKIHLMQLKIVLHQRATGFWPANPDSTAPWPSICGHENRSQCKCHWERQYSCINGIWYSAISYWNGLTLTIIAPQKKLENRCHELFPRITCNYIASSRQ